MHQTLLMLTFLDIPVIQQPYRSRCHCGLNPHHSHNQTPLYIRYPVPYQLPYVPSFYQSEQPGSYDLQRFREYSFGDEYDSDELQYAPQYYYQQYRQKTPRHSQKSPLETLLLAVTKELESALSLKHNVESSVTANESESKKQKRSKDRPKRKGKEKEGGKRFAHETSKSRCHSNQFGALGKEIETYVESAPKDEVVSNSVGNLLNLAKDFLSTAALLQNTEEKRDEKRNEDPAAPVTGPSSSLPRKIIINDSYNQKQDEVGAAEESKEDHEDQEDHEDDKSIKSSSFSSSKDSDSGDSMIERLQKLHEPIVSNCNQEDWEKVQ